MQILVTGGAGYIGSHMARMLAKADVEVVALDSLERGHQKALTKEIQLETGNISDKEFVNKVFSKNKIDAVIHFAGYISVEESVNDPVRYFKNNLINPLVLLEVMRENNVNKLIFSSTAAVYGNPIKVPIPEDHLKNPTSSYGLSKWQFEQLLGFYSDKANLHSISLRYFNACGASLDGQYGEDHKPESHIIPLGLATAAGQKKDFSLFGTDYQTRDGSCERDYIHVEDLCQAHILALDALTTGHKTDVYNVGTGLGVTNREVIAQIQKATGIKFPIKEVGRRPGDPAILVADSVKLKKEFGWLPRYSDLETIVRSAWKWHNSHPQGYHQA